MEAFIVQIICTLCVWLLQACYTVLKVFYMLAGLRDVTTTDGFEGNLLNYVLFSTSSPVVNVFLNVFVISVGTTCLFLIVAIIKNMVTNKQPMTNLLAKAAGSILATLAVFLIAILGINIVTIILQQVNLAFGISSEASVIAIILNGSIDGNVPGTPVPNSGYDYWGTIDQIVERIEAGNFSYDSFFSGFAGTFLNMWPQGFSDSSEQIMTGGFNEWQCFFTSVALLVALLICSLGLIKRLLDIAFLIICLPLVSSTIVLDDGAKMKLWRETMISKVVLAFGSIIMVNLFLIIAPVLAQVTFFENKGINSVVHMMIIVGLAFCLPTGQTLFARLMGTSAEESREMMQALRTAKGATMAGAALGMGAVGFAKRGLLGGQNKYGKTSNGLIGKPVRALGGEISGRVTAPINNLARRALPSTRQANLHNAYAQANGADALANANKYDLKNFQKSGGVKDYQTMVRQNLKNSKANYKSAKLNKKYDFQGMFDDDMRGKK